MNPEWTDTGLNDGDLALAAHDRVTQGSLVLSDTDTSTKGFPWPQVMAVLKRHVPELALPTKGDRRDAAMKAFWRRHGKTIGAFEILAQKVAASDYVMARNGHIGRGGRPFPWSWIFDKNGKGKVRADAIMDDEYSTEAMAFVIERNAKAAAPKMTKVMRPGNPNPIEVNLAETYENEPRYKVLGTHSNGLPEVIDYRD